MRALQGKHFHSDAGVKEAVQDFLGNQPQYFYSKGIELLPQSWDLCLNAHGDFFRFTINELLFFNLSTFHLGNPNTLQCIPKTLVLWDSEIVKNYFSTITYFSCGKLQSLAYNYWNYVQFMAVIKLMHNMMLMIVARTYSDELKKIGSLLYGAAWHGICLFTATKLARLSANKLPSWNFIYRILTFLPSILIFLGKKNHEDQKGINAYFPLYNVFYHRKLVVAHCGCNPLRYCTKKNKSYAI